MIYGCVDIGSNTTRLLVAEVSDGVWRELMTQRAYTLIAKNAGKDGKLGRKLTAAVSKVAATQADLARQLGAEQIEVVATAAVRAAPDRQELVDAVRERAGLEVRILTGHEEAQLAFIGATKRLGTPAGGRIVVIDVGGGSTELAVGTVDEGPTWDASFRVGSAMLTEAYVSADPPKSVELARIRQHVAGVFEGLELPPVEKAVAVGGTATSLKKLVGTELDHETLERGIRILGESPIAELQERFDVTPERAHVLPAGMLILEELSDLIGLPLQIGNGGLREGVIVSSVHDAETS